MFKEGTCLNAMFLMFQPYVFLQDFNIFRLLEWKNKRGLQRKNSSAHNNFVIWHTAFPLLSTISALAQH